jgi:hypothetical protein
MLKRRAEIPNPKLQIPNIKSQKEAAPQIGFRLEFGVLDLFGIWILGFGIS